jgi:capsular exopolysaccharide synthesis family protein
MMSDERYVDFEAEDSIDIKAFLLKCLRYWYIFGAVLMVALCIAIVINRFSEPVYRVTSRLLIKDEENPLDPQNFIGASLYGNPYKLQNEIGMLQSKSLTRRTLKNLDFYVSSFEETRFKSIDLYKGAPFVIQMDTGFDQPLGVKFNLKFINDTLLIINALENQVVSHNFRTNSNTGIIDNFHFSDTVAFGELCGNQYCRFRIIPNFQMLHLIKEHRSYSFRINSLSQLVNQYRISDIEAEKNSSILSLSIRCGNIQAGTDYLNELGRVFLEKGLERDDRIATSTIKFIDDQLKGITDSLRFSEDNLQRFRSTRGVTNIDYQAQQTYEQMEELRNQEAQLIVKSKYYNYLRDYLIKNNQVNDLIAPSSMDINDPLLNNLIIELTRLYGERAEMSFNSIRDNPYLQSLEAKITETKKNLIENTDNIIKTSEISLKEIESRISGIESTIDELPASQREFLVIERKFKLNDAIYTYLLTKRSEVQISKASNVPSNEILDQASSDDFELVSPNTRMNFIIAFLLGLFIPAVFIYLKDYFKNKISDKHEIQSITSVPIIGHILHNTHKTGLVVNAVPSSTISESFRSLRTNFQFFTKPDEKNVILITSIIKGEGKSFTSVNLGSVFAQAGKKVVILDFDLRKARLGQYLEIQSDDGLSRYLSNHVNLEKIIFQSGIENLDVIPSGPIPPNPLELISSDKTSALFEELKRRYDVLLIDSPPIALVSDALLLLRFANIRLIVVRQNYTPRLLFESVLHDLEKRGINALNIVLNDDRGPMNGYYGYYGYGVYGYGNEDEKRSLRQKISAIFGR